MRAVILKDAPEGVMLEGAQACADGLTVEHCPYPITDPKFQAWREGFGMQAYRRKERAKEGKRIAVGVTV